MRSNVMLSALLALAVLAIFGRETPVSASPLSRAYVSVNGAVGSGYDQSTGIGTDVRLGVSMARWLDLELEYGYMPFSSREKKHDAVYYNSSWDGPSWEQFTDYSRQVKVNTYLGAVKLKPEWLRSDRMQPYFIGGAGLMRVQTTSFNVYVPSENYAKTENKLALKGGVGMTIPLLRQNQLLPQAQKNQLLLQAEVSRIQGPISYLNSALGLSYQFR